MNDAAQGAVRIGALLEKQDWLDTETSPEEQEVLASEHEWTRRSLQWEQQLNLTVLRDEEEDTRAAMCEHIATTFDIGCPLAFDRDDDLLVARGLQDGWDWIIGLRGGKFFSGPAAKYGEVARPRAAKPVRLSRSLAELRDQRTEVDWLLLDQLEARTNVIVVGQRGSLKSFLVLDWSLRVAVFEGHPVLVISAEGRDADRRAMAWVKAHAPGVALENVPFRIVERRLDLTDDENMKLIRAECDAMRDEYGATVKLCAFDTISKLSGSLDENSNTDTKAFIGKIDLFARELGATTITVAHVGHSAAGRARGASALGADTDAEHLITRDPATGTINVTRERFKSSPELPPLIYKWRVVDLGRLDKRGRPVTSLVLDQLHGEVAKEARVQKSRRMPKKGKPQRIVLDAATAACASKPHFCFEGDLFEATALHLGERAKRQVERAVKALIKSGWLFDHGGGKLSVHAQLASESTDAVQS